MDEPGIVSHCMFCTALAFIVILVVNLALSALFYVGFYGTFGLIKGFRYLSSEMNERKARRRTRRQPRLFLTSLPIVVNLCEMWQPSRCEMWCLHPAGDQFMMIFRKHIDMAIIQKRGSGWSKKFDTK